MAKKKRVTRKQLFKEADELLSFSKRLFLAVVEHRKQISAGLGAFLVIVIAISMIRFFSDRSENEASALLEQTVVKYETAMKDNPETAFAAVNGDFQRILGEYGGKDAGKRARMIYAGICYDSGNSDKAIELYEESLGDFDAHPDFRNFILAALGYAYEENKDYKNAVACFEKIAQGTDSLMKDEAFFNLGRLYTELGEPEKSKEAFDTLVSDYGDSMYIEMVKDRLAG